MDVSRNKKLFRAIVVMGAAMTTPACGDDDCGKCVPVTDARVATIDGQVSDAGIDTNGPTDGMPVDVVAIL